MRNDKIEFLVRKNNGKRIIDEKIELLRNILGRSLLRDAFIDLEASDKVRFDFYDSFSTNEPQAKKLVTKNIHDVEVFLNQLTAQELLSEGIFFMRDSDQIGGLHLSFEEFSKFAIELLDFDKDTVFYVEPKINKWVYLTCDENGDRVYEVQAYI